MSKESDRAALEAMMAASAVRITKLPDAPREVPVVEKEPYVKPKKVKRNWALQRRYDEQHGTVNGYDPKIEAWKKEY